MNLTLEYFSNNLSFKYESLQHSSFPLQQKSFSIHENPVVALKFNCGLLDPPSYFRQHDLVPYTATTLVKPIVWPPCMDSSIRNTLDTRNPHVHGSIANSVLLIRTSNQVEPSTLTPHLNPKPWLRFSDLSFTFIVLNFPISTQCETSPHTCTPKIPPPPQVWFSSILGRNGKVEHYISEGKTHKPES